MCPPVAAAAPALALAGGGGTLGLSAVAAPAAAGGLFGLSSGTLGLISFGLSAAQQAFSFVGQQQASDTEAARHQAVADATKRSAEAALAIQVSGENQRLVETRTSASNQKQRVAIDAAKARSRIRTASGEAGVTGVSVNNLLSDFFRQEANQNDAITQNVEFAENAAKNNIEGFRAGAQSRTTAALPNPVPRPSLFSTALRVGGAAFDSFNTFSDFDRARDQRREFF